MVERYSGKALNRRTFQWVDKRFSPQLPLLRGPVHSVDAISYLDGAGAEIELEPEAWHLGADAVCAASGTAWPSSNGLAGSVRVSFTAGYDDAEMEAPALIAAVCAGIA